MTVRSATERAYDETKAAILDGSLPGGHTITEGGVSRQLGISRTPVREAFLRLQAEGLIQLFPKRGAVVCRVGLDELDAILEAREVIEVHALTTLLTTHAVAPPTLVAALLEHLHEMSRSLRSRELVSFLDAETAFHHDLVEAVENPFFTQMLGMLRERQRRMALANRHIDTLQRSYEDHRRLVAAIEDGDLDATISAYRAHLRMTRSRVAASA